MTLTEQNNYRLGVAFVAVSAFFWSLSGLFMRVIETDLPTILFVRGMISGCTVFTLFVVVERANAWAVLQAMRWPTLVAAVLSAAAMISGLGSFYYTTIADSMVIYATTPFITAFLAYFYIGEKPSRATVIASTIAFSGVLYMVTDHQGGGSMLGKSLAVIMSITVAALAVVMRKHRSVSMLPAMAASAWLTSIATAPFASPMSVGVGDIWPFLGFGIVQSGFGLALYTFGAKRIPAVDASLLTALEVPFTPLWVWILMNEVPARATQIGGTVVLIALFGHILAEVRRNRVSAPLGHM